MAQDWQQLTRLTQARPFVIDRVRLADTGIAIDGPFELPPLARLSGEDQVFVAAFVRCHGSIKQMERMFGVSYPTVKGRLNRIGEQLPFVQVRTSAPRRQVLAELERGEITVEQALERLREE